MATKCFRLIGMFVLMITYLSCNMKKSIVGKYYHEKLGLNYILELRSDGTFMQTLINDNKLFVNDGKYNIYLNVIKFTFWKSKKELINTPKNKGGCAGCELNYKQGKLHYYTDPDGLPEDVFIKMNE